MKHFSFSERLHDNFSESKNKNANAKTRNEQTSLLESRQDFKNSNQSTYFTRPKSFNYNDQSQTLTIDHLGLTKETSNDGVSMKLSGVTNNIEKSNTLQSKNSNFY